MFSWPYAVFMASMAAMATGFGTSDTTPSTFAAPCRCKTFAKPIAEASSHQRDRSVSMMTRGPVGPGAGALVVGALVVDDPLRDADSDEPDAHAPDAIARRVAATTRDGACRRRPVPRTEKVSPRIATERRWSVRRH